MGYLKMGQIPKHLQKKFDKATLIVKTEHKKFIKGLVNEFTSNKGAVEGGARYDSEINQGYRVFRKKDTLLIMIHPYYYSVKID